MTTPDPLVSIDVDLRDFAFMPLDVLRLRDSELAATPDAEAFRCSVLSWCVSWHQIPAGSLPDDDATLARLLGFGRDLKGWKKVRSNGGLHGWVKCADGRLYHPVVAEKARDAWAAKLAQRQRTEAARRAREEARQRQQQQQLQGMSQTNKGSVTKDVTTSKGQGQGQGQGIENHHQGDTVVAGSATPPTESPAQPAQAPDGAPQVAPPSSQPSIGKAGTSTGSRLPADWVLPKAWGEWALQEQPSWTPERVRQVADCFRDHWHAKAGADARKADWQAAWRNWVRKEGAMRAHGQPSRAQAVSDQNAAAVEEAKRLIFGEGETHATI